MQADLAQHGRPINGVERVAEIHLQEAFVNMAGVPLHPLPGSVDGGLGAQGDGDTNLKRPEVLRGGLTHRAAEALASQTTPGFTNGDGRQPPSAKREGWPRPGGGPTQGEPRHAQEDESPR